MGSSIYQEWEVLTCPCNEDGCRSAIIAPGIVTNQGALYKEEAEHIVAIHNQWILGGIQSEAESSRLALAWQYNRNSFFNKGLEAAQIAVLILREDHDEEEEVTIREASEAIKELYTPWWPKEIEDQYRRRSDLASKKFSKRETLTEEELKELEELTEIVGRLPYASDPQDLKAKDYISEAAALLRKHDI